MLQKTSVKENTTERSLLSRRQSSDRSGWGAKWAGGAWAALGPDNTENLLPNRWVHTGEIVIPSEHSTKSSNTFNTWQEYRIEFQIMLTRKARSNEWAKVFGIGAVGFVNESSVARGPLVEVRKGTARLSICQVRGGNALDCNDSPDLTVNKWYAVKMQLSDGKMRFWFDGTLTKTDNQFTVSRAVSPQKAKIWACAKEKKAKCATFAKLKNISYEPLLTNYPAKFVHRVEIDFA